MGKDYGNGTFRKAGHNVGDVGKMNYNTDQDNVTKKGDYGTINAEVRKKYPMSKRRSK